MSIPKKHHFLPVCYLDSWCGADGRLQSYTIPYNKIVKNKRKGPKAIGFEKFLYSIKNRSLETGQDAELFFFRPVDDAVAPVLKNVIQHGVFQDNTQLQIWQNFLSTLMLRMPDDILKFRHLTECFSKMLNDNARDLLHLPKYEAVDKVMVQSIFAKLGEEYAHRGIENQIKLMKRMAQKHIADLHWEVLHMKNSPVELLVSDRPVTFSKLDSSTYSISVPISPKHLFVASNDKNCLREISQSDDKEIIFATNLALVSQARYCVVTKDNSQQKFIFENFGGSEGNSFIDHFGAEFEKNNDKFMDIVIKEISGLLDSIA